MKVKNLVILIMSMVAFGCDPVNAQDKVYASKLGMWNSDISYLNVNPVSGVSSGNFNSVTSVQHTAAIGYGIYGGVGYILSLQYNNESSHVDIYATKVDGTGTNTKIMNNAIIAGSDNIEMDYVRLGIDATGTGWIVCKKSNTNTLYIASFTWSGVLASNTVNVTKRGQLTTNDNSNSIFINGDLAIASNTLFILANNGSGSTKIYTIPLSTLTSAGTSSNNTIISKWTLKDISGNNFTGNVNGFAFSSTGSAYLSTNSGLYFIDQTTVNSISNGTVLCSLIKSESNISDLATEYIPLTTTLPVKIKSVKVYIKRN